MKTSICIFFHCEKWSWLTETGNNKQKNENGTGVRPKVDCKMGFGLENRIQKPPSRPSLTYKFSLNTRTLED